MTEASDPPVLRFTLDETAERSLKARAGALGPADEAIPAPEPRNARAVPLDPDQTAESAARDVLIECARQIAANVTVVGASDAPEGPHQLRVGLRRLRTALALFGPIVGCPALERLNAEARWLGQEVGALRDLDVALAEIVEPEAEAHAGDAGFAALGEALGARRAASRAALREDLRGRRAQAFLLDLSRCIETRPWLAPGDYAQTARLATPLAALARERLDKRWRKVSGYGRHIETLDTPERHELRKELKKLRYAIEFLGPVYPPKKVKGFVNRLRDLQDLFGALNDLAMAEELFTGPDAPCADMPEAQRAVGRILGVRTLRSEEDWHRARGLWHSVHKAGPFWR